MKAARADAEATLVREIEAVLGPDARKIIRDYSRLDEARAYIAGCGGLFSRVAKR